MPISVNQVFFCRWLLFMEQWFYSLELISFSHNFSAKRLDLIFVNESTASLKLTSYFDREKVLIFDHMCK